MDRDKGDHDGYGSQGDRQALLNMMCGGRMAQKCTFVDAANVRSRVSPSRSAKIADCPTMA
jgi:hypothetical protein